MTTLTAALVLPRWWAAGWRARRATRRAWKAGADLLAMTATITQELPTMLPPWRTAPPPDSDAPQCPNCRNPKTGRGGTRCRPWREGRDCATEGAGERPVYAAGRALPRDGRHDRRVRIAAWIHTDHMRQLRHMVEVDPDRYAARLGRPVQLPHGRVVLP
jgi:hypothetical protein